MSYSDDWKRLMDEVHEFIVNSNKPVVYRGHSRSQYKLVPGLFRLEFETISEYLKYERNVYNWFSTLGHIHHEKRDWELLFTMQHHGVKTRLLDWTESFTIALFFAMEKWNPQKGNAHLWMLDASRMNQLTVNDLSVGTLNGTFPYQQLLMNSTEETEKRFRPMVIFPLRQTPRIIAQQGLFSMQTFKPLEEWRDGTLVKEGVMKRVELPPSIYDDARIFLEQSGINDFSVYPDLDTLAKHVHARVMGD